jgi:manganese transport protein
VALNAALVFSTVDTWVRLVARSGASVAGVPAAWLAAAGLYGLVFAVGALLVWITVKPWIRPSPPWTPLPSVQLDWVEALRPRPLGSIGVALEHSQADAEILNRALSLARPGETRLVLLHVVDTPMTGVYGDETADREAGADERFLNDVVRVLHQKGYDASPVLLHGPNRARQLVNHFSKEPVDLLVVGSHGHGMIRDMLFGQTVDPVRHGLNIAMLIARPERSGQQDAAATDGVAAHEPETPPPVPGIAAPSVDSVPDAIHE